MALGDKAARTYVTKKTTGKFNAHRSKYTDAQIKKIQDANAHWLYYFGYANHPSQDNSRTAFFEFDNPKKEHLDAFYGYRKDNEKWLKKVVEDQGWKGQKYHVNGDPDMFDIYDPATIHKMQDPAFDWARQKLGYSKEEVIWKSAAAAEKK